jgi:phospholipid/cholesterol/gamma-HCH transport system substrate-binding protein
MMIRAPALVGLVLLSAGVSLSWFIVQSSEDKFSDEMTYPLAADFSDASGIRWKTRVQISGIDVGKISAIEHVQTEDGGLTARVTIRILNDYRVFRDALLRKAPESLLGDFRLDLSPGSPAAGQLAPGERIGNVQSISDMDAIQAELREVAKNVNKITASFARVLSGPNAEGSLESILKQVENSLAQLEVSTRLVANNLQRNDQTVDAILSDVRMVTSSLAMSTGQGGDVDKVAKNLVSLSTRLDELAQQISRSLYGADGNPVSPDSPLRRSVENLTSSVEHLNSIVKKVDHGVGSIGRFINDPGIAEKFEDALDNTDELLGGLSRLETEVELRAQYDIPYGNSVVNTVQGIKNIVGVRIKPRPDKMYILEAIADHRGREILKETRTTTGTVVNPETNQVEFPDNEQREYTYETSFNALKLSAQFAKRYYFMTLRFGIIENTGGLGMDFHILNDKLELRLDAFDFERRFDAKNINKLKSPRVRSTFLWEVFNHIWLQGGIDDPLEADTKHWFLGGMLRFTDDDLKTLMTVAPSP